MKRLIFVALTAGLAAMSFVFCSSQGGVQGLRGGVFSRSVDQGGTTTTSNNDDDDDDYRDCTDSDTCEVICERIYDESWSDCNDLETDEVSDLQRVWKELRGKNVERSDLDDIDLDHFEEYLEIGVDGWLREIEGYDKVEPYTPASAQTVLKWLLETEGAAQVLSDTDEGYKILKQLINTAAKTDQTNNTCSKDCKLSANVFPTNAVKEHVIIKGVPDADAINKCEKGNGSLKLQYYSSSSTKTDLPSVPKIEFDRNLCLYRNLTATLLVDGKDIFTASAKEDNEYLFDLAYRLLDDVCSNDLDSRTDSSEEKVACRKALMCALAIHEEVSASGTVERTAARDNIARWDGWEFIDNEQDLGEDHDECTAGPDGAAPTDDDDAFDEENLN